MIDKNIKRAKLFISNLNRWLKFNDPPLIRIATILVFLIMSLTFLFFIGTLLRYGDMRSKIIWISIILISMISKYKLEFKNKQNIEVVYIIILFFVFLLEFQQYIDNNKGYIFIIFMVIALILMGLNRIFKKEITTYLSQTKHPIKNAFWINLKSKKLKEPNVCPLNTFKRELHEVLQKIEENSEYYCVAHRTIKLQIYQNKDIEILEQYFLKKKSLKKIRDTLINEYCKDCEDGEKKKCEKKYKKENQFYAIRFRKN